MTTTQTGQAKSTRSVALLGNPIDANTPTVNPWLDAGNTAGPSRKRQHGISASSSAADKSVKSLKKAAGQDKAGREEEGRVEITLDPDVLLSGQTSSKKKRPGTSGDGTGAGDEHDVGGGDSDADGDNMGTMPRKRVRFGQRDLVAEAFAGDNVVQVSVTRTKLVM